jgi:hypothetical protein
VRESFVHRIDECLMLWCVFGSSAYSLRRGDSNGPTVVSVPAGLGQRHEMKSTNCRKYMYTHHIAAVTDFRWVGPWNRYYIRPYLSPLPMMTLSLPNMPVNQVVNYTVRFQCQRQNAFARDLTRSMPTNYRITSTFYCSLLHTNYRSHMRSTTPPTWHSPIAHHSVIVRDIRVTLLSPRQKPRYASRHSFVKSNRQGSSCVRIRVFTVEIIDGCASISQSPFPTFSSSVLAGSFCYGAEFTRWLLNETPQ